MVSYSDAGIAKLCGSPATLHGTQGEETGKKERDTYFAHSAYSTYICKTMVLRTV